MAFHSERGSIHIALKRRHVHCSGFGLRCLETASKPVAESQNNMRIPYFRLLVALGSVIVLNLSACAGSNGSLQSRIERKVETPQNENVQIGTAHYNTYAKDFEEPWPFGPYSN
jgi:hypothetical protein